MKHFRRNYIFLLIAILAAVVGSLLIHYSLNQIPHISNSDRPTSDFSDFITTLLPSPTPTLVLIDPPLQKVLPTNYHTFQTFNNCGPAALSMTLSHYGLQISQQELGEALRPYQIASGDNDDKSVTLEELAEKSKEYGFVPFHRPGGTVEKIKQFITYEMPILTRTLTKTSEDIGHYRVVKGYDDLTSQIIQDDSLQGKNLSFSYEEFDSLWQRFDYEYLVLVPKEKVEIASAILGDELDPIIAWEKSVQRAREQLIADPNDIYAGFNLTVALYHVGDFQRSVEEFEKVETRLPFRTLWYQIEPIRSYFELGDYKRVFQITDLILNNHNRAFSELYLIRGEIYKIQGDYLQAQAEFEKAIHYNKNLSAAHDAMAGLIVVTN